MTDLSEFDPFSPLPDELTANSLPSPLSPLQAKLGDLSITSVEDVGGKKGFPLAHGGPGLRAAPAEQAGCQVPGAVC